MTQRVPSIVFSLALLLCGVHHAYAEEPSSISSPDRPSTPAAPDVQITSPAGGQFVNGVVHVQVAAHPVESIDHVAVYADSTLIGSDFSAPYEVVWDTREDTDGPYVLVARARGLSFTEVVSPKHAVTVDNTPPMVTWVAPPDGSIVGGDVPLSAQASDILGLQGLRFLVDGVLLKELAQPPFAVTWNTLEVPNTRHTLQARAIDRAGNSVTTTPSTVKVSNVNRAPRLAPIEPKIVSEGSPLIFTVDATDPDGARDPLTYEATDVPPWLSFNPKTREFRGTPGYLEATLKHPRKDYPVMHVKVCDPEPRCDSKEVTIAVLDTNRAPVLGEPIGNRIVKEEKRLTVQMRAVDPDGDAVTCTQVRIPKWTAFNQDSCTVKGLPGYEVASQTDPSKVFHLLVDFCDGKQLCTRDTLEVIVVNVNRPPEWAPIDKQQIQEGRKLTVEVSATDPDDDPLKLTATPLPETAVFTDHGDGHGIFTWTPLFYQGGKYALAMVVNDGELTAALPMEITVIDTKRSISGTIVDAIRKRPVPNVPVQLVQAGVTLEEITTDERGFYVFGDLNAGEYVIKPSATSKTAFTTTAKKLTRTYEFEPKRHPVTLESGDQRDVNFLATSKE